MKLGDRVWLFIGRNTVDHNKELARGEYIASKNGLKFVRVGNKIYKRKLCEIAKVTGKEKLDFS